MNPNLIKQLAEQLGLPEKFVQATVNLLMDGATIPFIARYRKELTNSLNEVQLTAIRDGLQQFEELEKRRAFILETIEEQGKLTPELEQKIKTAHTLTTLEDLYLPYKPKRRTRATIAREKGLEGLAKILMSQRTDDVDKQAAAFVDQAKEVPDIEAALDGARDIMAEWMSENAKVRANMRQLFMRKGMINAKLVKGKEEEAEKYQDYFEWEEKINRVPSHRFLAMMRGAKEGLLRVSIAPHRDDALELLDRFFLKGENAAADQVAEAIDDAYKRLLQPTIETEIRKQIKEKADQEAIEVFVTNLRELLLAAPMGQKNVLALDPGFRTGCKLVCLDQQGQLVYHSTIYPHDRSNIKRFEATSKVEELCERYNIEAIAIGNGTAGRETHQFIKRMNLPNIKIVMVDESGASIYSASAVAREEFPNEDITVRGSVSIGRRLMDPLAELVKIDPKSIGVGQYQHDVNQTALQKSLDDVVESCVNGVGVEVNTASKQLLNYVSGLGPKTAQNIVTYRNEHGPFTSKKEIKKVAGIGPKAFEQAAGFIRIRNAKNPLDASAVHPESYKTVEKIAKDQACTVRDLIGKTALIQEIPLEKYVTDKVGLPTLKDIVAELAKPGRDPRQDFETFQFEDSITTIEDVQEGMELPGIITNVTNFGAFVDIGIKENGLVHVSQLADRFVRDPKKVVKVRQKVKVRVVSVDYDRKRIQLSMRKEG